MTKGLECVVAQTMVQYGVCLSGVWGEWGRPDRREASTKQGMTSVQNRVVHNGCEEMAPGQGPGNGHMPGQWRVSESGLVRWAICGEDCDQGCATAASLTRVALSFVTAPHPVKYLGFSEATAIMQQSYTLYESMLF